MPLRRETLKLKVQENRQILSVPKIQKPGFVEYSGESLGLVVCGEGYWLAVCGEGLFRVRCVW